MAGHRHDLDALRRHNQRLTDALTNVVAERGLAPPTAAQDRREHLWRRATAITRDQPSLGWADALCEVAVQEVQGVHGASVSLRAAGMHEQLAATGPWVEELDALHFTVGQGPALTALATGVPVLVPDLAAAHDRWPWYVTAAGGTGLAAVYAFPLRMHDVALATLTLCGRRTGPLSVSAANDAGILGDLCATAVAHDLDDRFANAVADRPLPSSGP